MVDTVINAPLAFSMTTSDDQFHLELEEVDEEEFELRIKSYGKKQHRNFTGYDQKGPAVVYGRRFATVHGRLIDDDGNDKAGTLIILDWNFQSRDPDKRFKFVRINMVFAGPEGCLSWEEPAVYKMVPQGRFSLLRSTFTEEKKKSLAASLGIQPSLVSADVSPSYELSRTTEIEDSVHVSGQTYLDYSQGPERDPDRPNAIEWTFSENTSQRSGLPTVVRTPVLLARETDAPFTATFSIRTKVSATSDLNMRFKKLLGQKEQDDPIVFDPTMKEKTPLNQYSGALHEVDLMHECAFILNHAVPGPQGGSGNP